MSRELLESLTSTFKSFLPRDANPDQLPEEVSQEVQYMSLITHGEFGQGLALIHDILRRLKDTSRYHKLLVDEEIE